MFDFLKSKKPAFDDNGFKISVVNETLSLGHLVKYNVFLISKAIVFHALMQKPEYDVNKAASIADAVMKAFEEQDNAKAKADKKE